jgi:hypothetical protein
MSNFPKDLCIPIRAQLHELDSEKQTYGCRQSNPDICGYCHLEGICAFASKDNICKHPSAKWRKIYKELKEAEDEIL